MDSFQREPLHMLYDLPDGTAGLKSVTVGNDGVVNCSLAPGGGVVLFQ
jgi:hypothetical protein